MRLKLKATSGTTYKIFFDFTNADQKAILDKLQARGYSLMAFKGASGPNQVSAGLPAWFVVPFNDMLGNVEIDYQPQYMVYAYYSAQIGTDTIIQMQDTSPQIGLGTALALTQDGSFISGTAKAPADSIVLQDSRAAGSPDITIGLAAKIAGEFYPFCAFTSTPQGSLVMTPHENCCLFAARTDLVSGSVTGAIASPGCEFSFSAAAPDFDLAIEDSTFAIVGTGQSVVTPVSSGQDLAELLDN